MANRRIWRICALVLILLLLGAAFAVSLARQRSTCMGVPFLSEEEDLALSWDDYRDWYGEDPMDVTLTFRGEPAAVHSGGHCVLIPQDIGEDTAYYDLSGALSTAEGYRIAFSPDPAFDELAAAVAEDHTFWLVIFDGEGRWTDCAVTFTTLPVIRLDGEAIYTNEKERDVMEGEVCLWAPADPETGHPSVKTSRLLWNVRGDTTAGMPKVPWKLSLKDAEGGNRDLSLLGLGADDDWILNAMSLDDTDLKERVFFDVWNDLAGQTEHLDYASRGEYAEVVTNGEYMGLYLLQRRIDGKYLGLTGEEVLLKGAGSWVPEDMSQSYEIVQSPLSDGETVALMEGFWDCSDVTGLHVENFVDVNLMLQVFSAPDNAGYKNMYYLLRPEEGEWKLYLIPWDTDMSLGVTWAEPVGFVYDYELSLYQDCQRMEYWTALEQLPGIWELSCARWRELREDWLTAEYLWDIIARYEEVLVQSGAPLRDEAWWGLYYGGADTMESLYAFVEARLNYLDEYYTAE